MEQELKQTINALQDQINELEILCHEITNILNLNTSIVKEMTIVFKMTLEQLMKVKFARLNHEQI